MTVANTDTARSPMPQTWQVYGPPGGGGISEQQLADAVAGVVGAAPEALDTLNELAAALGDDANFAASVTTALAGKISATEKGAANGVATLDSDAKLTPSQSATSGAALSVESFGGVGDNSTDNAAALVAAENAARLAGVGIRMGKGIFRSSVAPTIDWSGGFLEGEGSGSTTVAETGVTVLRITDTAANGVNLGGTGDSAVRYDLALRNLVIEVPNSGTGVGINAGGDRIKNHVEIENVRVRRFGSHGLVTKFCDYLRMDGVIIRNNGGDPWYADQATNACTMRGGALVGTGVSGNGAAGLRAVDMDGCGLWGVEFGQIDYGIVESGGGSQGVTFTDCRMETVYLRHVVLGNGSIPYTSRWAFNECSFYGNNTLTPLVLVDGARQVTFDKCVATQLPAGGVFVKSNRATSINKAIKVIDCVVDAGRNLLEGNGAPGTMYNRNVNVVGGDASDVFQGPFALSFRVKAADLVSAGDKLLGAAPRSSLLVRSVYVTSDTAIGNSSSDYYTFDVRRFTNSNQGTTASRTTQTAGLWATAFRSQSLTLGSQATFNQGDTFVLNLGITGSPTALGDLVVTVNYDPSGD
ncbi:MAG TPA: hypothetical protein VM345_01895 [Acidimicrobiales bacterium]|nr:hypothetical protein [Acidimicrobiales bacterium]